ncbi:MAG: hypothetical protein LBE80_11235 [Deltaproteobacteria bacterium]|jgi:hypothetical protein|nr:hypothetical protein [Deltaproteobacteria bacterium]
MTTIPGSNFNYDFTTLPDANSSAQLRYAALQMLLASDNKEKASKYMDSIKAEQDKSKEIAKWVREARDLQLTAQKATGKTSKMPQAMIDFFEKNDIKHYYSDQSDTSNLNLTEEQWKYNIDSLEQYLETVGVDTQQKMVYVQDFMAQYNSYLTGANSAVQKSAQTLGALAKGN